MNISYTEINDLENNNGNNPYWDLPKPKTEQKKKVKFGYDDILSSINLVVNNGVLQYMTPADKNQQSQQSQQYDPNTFTHSKNGFQQTQPQMQKQAQQNVKKITVDPQVKNSAIYNKYFKNYKDPNETPEVKIPKTKEELRKMLIEQHIKRIQAQKRIALVKPKKMFFGAVGTPMPIYTSQNAMNRLFKFK
jgi:hypothetical protein